MKRLRSNSRGDTIVEVLISMAIAAAVLGSAYTITNRTLANSRQAQEHSEAAKLVQAQLEQLRTLALKSTIGAAPFQSGTAYCVDNKPASPTPGQLKQFVASPPPSAPANYPAECKDIGSVAYRTGFVYDSTQSTFRVYVNWDGATGGQDQVSMSYKVYPQ